MLSSAASLPAPGTSQGLAWRAQWRQEVGTSQELEEHPIAVMRGTGGVVLLGASPEPETHFPH